MNVVCRSRDTYAVLPVEKKELVRAPGFAFAARFIAARIGALVVASPVVWKTTTLGGRIPGPRALRRRRRGSRDRRRGRRRRRGLREDRLQLLPQRGRRLLRRGRRAEGGARRGGPGPRARRVGPRGPAPHGRRRLWAHVQ